MKSALGRRPYRQVARARAQTRTRSALLDAADRELFSGRWAEASLEEVAASAGVTKQTLLRHFGSKAGLWEQAVLRGYRRVRDQRWAARRGDVAEAVDNLLDHYGEWGERALRLDALEGAPGAMLEIRRRARRLHYEWVEHAFGPLLDGFGAQGRARRRAALIALCDVHTWWLLSHDLRLSRGEVRATLAQAIEGVLGGEG
jgi:AcrR family transcriptional regulator